MYEFKGDIKSPSKSKSEKCTSICLAEEINHQRSLVRKKDLAFSIVSSGLYQGSSQCNPPILLISYSGLICDVILAKDNQQLHVLCKSFCPLRLYHNIN